MHNQFQKPGYIRIHEYLAALNSDTALHWKLPLGVGDRIHLFILELFARHSWFRDKLYIEHQGSLSPFFNILTNYLNTEFKIDTIRKKTLISNAYHSYFIEKKITIAEKEYLINGQGVDQHEAVAYSKALGEFVERMISGIFDKSEAVLCSRNELVEQHMLHVYPPDFHHFLPEQLILYPELRSSPDAKISWVKGFDLDTKKTVLIPKQLTSWFVSSRPKNEKLLLHPTTNGSAGYFTKDGAILRALYETIQRDGFFVHWLTKTAPRTIDQDTLPHDIKRLISEFTSRGFEIYLVDTMSLGIPSVAAIAVNRYVKHANITIGSGTSVMYHTAISSALRELFTCIGIVEYANSSVSEDVVNGIQSALIPFTGKLGKIERQLYWSGKEKIAQFEWFFNGEKTSYNSLIKNDLGNNSLTDTEALTLCTNTLRSFGPEYSPVGYFPIHPSLARVGYHVAQVYIPAAFPLYLEEQYGTFKSTRLNEFIMKIGKSSWELNPLPHPFS